MSIIHFIGLVKDPSSLDNVSQDGDGAEESSSSRWLLAIKIQSTLENQCPAPDTAQHSPGEKREL